MWTDMSVRLLSLPALENLHRCELGGDTQVRRERRREGRKEEGVECCVCVCRVLSLSLPLRTYTVVS